VSAVPAVLRAEVVPDTTGVDPRGMPAIKDHAGLCGRHESGACRSLPIKPDVHVPDHPHRAAVSRSQTRPAKSQRLLLIAPHNSYRTGDFLASARSLGVPVMVASEGRHSLVSEIASGLHVDLHDPAALDILLAAHREWNFGGVVATDDASVELGSRIAQSLGLPHNPPQAALLSRRKDLARARLLEAGVAVPAHRLVDLDAPRPPQLSGLSYPGVVKPLSLSASRGVIRVNDHGELIAACARVERILAREFGKDDSGEQRRVLIETFISGPEVAVEGLLRDGRLDVLAIFDKPDPMEGPFFEETYYITPSRHDPPVREQIVETVAQACAALGLREGPVHAEARISGEQVWIMEVASRTIGGYCGRLLRFGTGHGLEDLVISHAIGKQLRVRPEAGAAGVLMIPIPEAGILRRVEGVFAARRVPWIEAIEISIREGYELVPLPEGASYLGFMFARAPAPAQAERALREAHARLKIVVAPLFRMQDAG
jgi:hypothetical protein